MALFAKIGNMMRLKEIRKSQGMTQQQVADALGLHLTNYNKLENGKTKLTALQMEHLARILHCSPADFILKQGDVRIVPVRQHVAAGVWQESNLWDEDDWYSVAVPDEPEYRHLTLYGAETAGPSMNRRYPERSALIYTSLMETGESPKPGRRYIIETERSDGLREATVKKLWKDDSGKLWLLPESHDPLHQQPIDLSAGDGEIVRIVGRVLYSVQREED
ncbi:transcriptional regulator with XRE-family HTH domain [Ensifer adhaerens]|uniref:Transcriptional regulator with XRE-family HTH domain n=1 Tax=Ensifer adhaerens TaxID=106592 RepID=A0ACC5SXI0_ENSAD|nr:LexA family transcriptional regulator [Ensifer adhaerens]MBP1873520.1 transcriptional regulator with XRE-family HTH domain [Ensifer adhaerens]